MHSNSTCGFGVCHEPASRVVTTRTAIGGRVELLCDAHTRRRTQLDQVLDDYAIDEPIPYALTDSGRAAIAS